MTDPNKHTPSSPNTTSKQTPSTQSAVQHYQPKTVQENAKIEPLTDLSAIQSYAPKNPKPIPIPKGMPRISDNHKQTSKAKKRPFKLSFLAPKYWGMGLLILSLLPLIYLPLRFQFWLGRMLGNLMYALAKEHKHTTLSNLELAYPEKMPKERERLAKQVFENQGIGIFETLCAWFRPDVFTRTVSISGLQHLMAIHKTKRPIILLGANYTTVDLGIRLFTQFYPIDYVSYPQQNKLLDWFFYNARRHIVDEQIMSKDISRIDQQLKQGHILYCLADQNKELTQSVLAPFFGVAAKTSTLPSQLAKLGDSANPPAVMTLHIYRQTANKLAHGRRPHYHLTITPALDNYPTHNERADATRVNETLESHIRIDPAQWMWFHKRYIQTNQ